jgi:hypothetical protein
MTKNNFRESLSTNLQMFSALSKSFGQFGDDVLVSVQQVPQHFGVSLFAVQIHNLNRSNRNFKIDFNFLQTKRRKCTDRFELTGSNSDTK